MSNDRAMNNNVAGIVLAGGRGSRVQHDVNKVYLPIGERDMLEYSLETMSRSPSVDRVVLVVRDEDRSRAENLVAEIVPAKLTNVVIGGATRHESEQAGLEALAGDIEAGAIGMVAIHDGARPFMTLDLLESTISVARHRGGAIPGLRVHETLYRIGDSPEALPQDALRRVQTPQVFWARPLLDAYRRAAAAGVEGVDTAETVERFSDLEVAVVAGDRRNIKLTFVEDFFLAEEYALVWDKGEWTDGE
jgi:2-C-methyl-D-erythritol 4-phosphate cytidylyltransferase